MASAKMAGMAAEAGQVTRFVNMDKIDCRGKAPSQPFHGFDHLNRFFEKSVGTKIFGMLSFFTVQV